MQISKMIYKILIRPFISKQRKVYNKRVDKSTQWRTTPPVHYLWWEKRKKTHERYIKSRSWLTRKPWIVSLDWALTTYCTLACEDCSHYMTHFTKETHIPPISFERFKEELDALLACVDGIYILQLVGGETLMVKDLAEMIDYAAGTGKVCHIMPIINGTIIPQKKLLEVCAKYKGIVHVQMSDYLNNEDLRPRLKYDECIKVMDEAGVVWTRIVNKIWIGAPVFTPDFDKDRAEANYKTDCLFAQTLHILDGMLMVCPFHGWATKTGVLDNVEPKEYISLKELTTKKLYKWLSKPYYDLCGYCCVDNTPRPCGIQKEGMTCSR
jgi:hypothetical protein